MNSITMAIIFILFISFFFFQIIKKFLLNNLDKSINKRDYALTVTLSDMPLTRRFSEMLHVIYIKQKHII